MRKIWRLVICTSIALIGTVSTSEQLHLPPPRANIQEPDTTTEQAQNPIDNQEPSNNPLDEEINRRIQQIGQGPDERQIQEEIAQEIRQELRDAPEVYNENKELTDEYVMIELDSIIAKHSELLKTAFLQGGNALKEEIREFCTQSHKTNDRNYDSLIRDDSFISNFEKIKLLKKNFKETSNRGFFSKSIIPIFSLNKFDAIEQAIYMTNKSETVRNAENATYIIGGLVVVGKIFAFCAATTLSPIAAVALGIVAAVVAVVAIGYAVSRLGDMVSNVGVVETIKKGVQGVKKGLKEAKKEFKEGTTGEKVAMGTSLLATAAAMGFTFLTFGASMFGGLGAIVVGGVSLFTYFFARGGDGGEGGGLGLGRYQASALNGVLCCVIIGVVKYLKSITIEKDKSEQKEDEHKKVKYLYKKH